VPSAVLPLNWLPSIFAESLTSLTLPNGLLLAGVMEPSSDLSAKLTLNFALLR